MIYAVEDYPEIAIGSRVRFRYDGRQGVVIPFDNPKHAGRGYTRVQWDNGKTTSIQTPASKEI